MKCTWDRYSYLLRSLFCLILNPLGKTLVRILLIYTAVKSAYSHSYIWMNHYMKQINKQNGTKVGFLTIHSIKNNGILLQKLFRPTVKKCSSCQENFFEASMVNWRHSVVQSRYTFATPKAIIFYLSVVL